MEIARGGHHVLVQDLSEIIEFEDRNPPEERFFRGAVGG